MIMKKKSVKTSGFSTVEYLISLFIFMNLFVLCSQIFYNINNHKNRVAEFNLVSYEAIVLRMETQLKEATFIEIEESRLIYIYRNQTYEYLVTNDHFILKIETTSYVLLENMKAINYVRNGFFLVILFTDMDNQIYQTQVIINGT